jgi:hypothetical protein
MSPQQNRPASCTVDDEHRTIASTCTAHSNDNTTTSSSIPLTNEIHKQHSASNTSHQDYPNTAHQPQPDNNVATGDILTSIKDPNTMRVYFQNINGIKKNNWIDWQRAAIQMKKLQIDVVGCAETNLSWTEPIRKYAQFQLTKYLQQANLAVSNSQDIGNTDYQPGGVANCINNKWTGRVIEQIHDPSGLGRWTGHILNGKSQQNIIIVTAYRPIKATGFQTTFQQQWRLLRRQSNDLNNDPDPRKQMVQDLQTQIIQWTNSKLEVILMWDANEGINKHNSSITRFMANTNLSPAHTHFPNASYARGSTCIDFIMATPTICSAIRHGGYLPYYDGIWHSDHRGIFIDISVDELFSGKTPTIPAHTARGLTSKSKTQVDRFICTLETNNKLPNILRTLQNLSHLENWSGEHHRQFEETDIAFTNELLHAETHCHLPHQASWHPRLHQQYLIYSYWRKTKSGIMNRKKINIQLENIKQKLDAQSVDVFQGNDKRSPRNQLKLACRNLQEQRKTANDLRNNHLSFQQELMLLTGKKSKAQIIATIQRSERRAICFKKFHTFTKAPRTAGGLAYALDLDSEGNYIRIQQENELDEKLHQRNRLHFAQAHGTPFTIPPMSTNLSFSGVTPFGTAVLQGDYKPPEIPTAAELILTELVQVRQTLSDTMPFTAMIKGLSKWRESTTTSPSGKHLGIYKSLITYHQQTNSAAKIKTNSTPKHQSAYIALRIQHAIINLAIRHTHTLERWKTVHNFFLEISFLKNYPDVHFLTNSASSISMKQTGT